MIIAPQTDYGATPGRKRMDTESSTRRDAEDLAILRALGVLEAKLTTIINAGLSDVKNSISQLRDAHMAAQLEQAKSNATFADRDRVEALARRIDTGQAEVVQLHIAVNSMNTDQNAIRKALDDLTTAVNKGHINLLTSGIGWLLAGAFTITGAILTGLLHH